MRAREHGGGDRRAERAGLAGAGDLHRAAGDVGVDLHEQRIFFGDAAGADDAVHRHAVFPDALDDRARAERGGLDQRAIDFGPRRVKGLSDQQAGEQRVDEDGAIAVVPVEREQAAWPGCCFAASSVSSRVQRGIAARRRPRPTI